VHEFYVGRLRDYAGWTEGTVGRIRVQVQEPPEVLLPGALLVEGSEWIQLQGIEGIAPGMFLSGPGLAPRSTVRELDPVNRRIRASAPVTRSLRGVLLYAADSGVSFPRQFESAVLVDRALNAGGTSMVEVGPRLGAEIALPEKAVWSFAPGQGDAISGMVLHPEGRLEVRAPGDFQRWVGVIVEAGTQRALGNLEVRSLTAAPVGREIVRIRGQDVVYGLNVPEVLFPGKSAEMGGVWEPSAGQAVGVGGVSLTSGGVLSVPSAGKAARIGRDFFYVDQVHGTPGETKRTTWRLEVLTADFQTEVFGEPGLRATLSERVPVSVPLPAASSRVSRSHFSPKYIEWRGER
jgi:hypothetical protein